MKITNESAHQDAFPHPLRAKAGGTHNNNHNNNNNNNMLTPQHDKTPQGIKHASKQFNPRQNDPRCYQAD